MLPDGTGHIGRPAWQTQGDPRLERITPVDPQSAQGKAKQLLDAVKAKLGIVPDNHFNNVASTSIDFPRVPALSA